MSVVFSIKSAAKSALVVLAMAVLPQAAHAWPPPQVFSADPVTPERFDSSVCTATDDNGVFLAAWCSDTTIGQTFGVQYARSTDRARTWSAPAVLNTNTSSTASHEDAPAVATNGSGTWIVAWSSEDVDSAVAGGARNILFARSTDHGVSFSNTAVLNASTSSPVQRNHAPAIASDGAGVWVAAWETGWAGMAPAPGSDGEISFARSTNGAQAWGDAGILNTDAMTDSRVDTCVRLATNRAGKWIAVWQGQKSLANPYGTDLDVYFSVSTDNGTTWTAPLPLNTNALTDTGADTLPDIACDASGNWVAVWMSNDGLGVPSDRGDKVLYTRTSDSATTWTAPARLRLDVGTTTTDVRPSVCWGGGAFNVAWDSFAAAGSAYGTDRDIFTARSTDGGATWSTPEPVNTTAAADTSDDHTPAFAVDAAGNPVAIWLTGRVDEGDILFTHTSAPTQARDWSLYE